MIDFSIQWRMRKQHDGKNGLEIFRQLVTHAMSPLSRVTGPALTQERKIFYLLQARALGVESIGIGDIQRYDDSLFRELYWIYV